MVDSECFLRMSKLWNYSCSQLTLRPIFIEAANVGTSIAASGCRYKSSVCDIKKNLHQFDCGVKDQKEEKRIKQKHSLTNQVWPIDFLYRSIWQDLFSPFSLIDTGKIETMNQWKSNSEWSGITLNVQTESEKKSSIFLRPHEFDPQFNLKGKGLCWKITTYCINPYIKYWRKER